MWVDTVMDVMVEHFPDDEMWDDDWNPDGVKLCWIVKSKQMDIEFYEENGMVCINMRFLFDKEFPLRSGVILPTDWDEKGSPYYKEGPGQFFLKSPGIKYDALVVDYMMDGYYDVLLVVTEAEVNAVIHQIKTSQ
jgi:hypothetical protein